MCQISEKGKRTPYNIASYLWRRKPDRGWRCATDHTKDDNSQPGLSSEVWNRRNSIMDNILQEGASNDSRTHDLTGAERSTGSNYPGLIILNKKQNNSERGNIANENVRDIPRRSVAWRGLTSEISVRGKLVERKFAYTSRTPSVWDIYVCDMQQNFNINTRWKHRHGMIAKC